MQWRSRVGSAEEATQTRLLTNLRSLLEKELPTATSTHGGVTTLQRRGTEDLAQIGGGSLIVVKRFTGNVEIETGLLSKWVTRHWAPLVEAFDGTIRPTFLALILDVELSTEGIIDQSATRELMARYLKSPPGWEDIADAEFRISKELLGRYYLNFGLSSYTTINLAVQARPAVITETGADQKLSVQVEQTVTDRGLKVQVDANTKVNVLTGKGEIVVGVSDLAKCLELAVGGIDKELEPFLRMTK